MPIAFALFHNALYHKIARRTPSHHAADALPSGMQAMTPGTVPCVVSEGHDTAGLSPVSCPKGMILRDCPLCRGAKTLKHIRESRPWREYPRPTSGKCLASRAAFRRLRGELQTKSNLIYTLSTALLSLSITLLNSNTTNNIKKLQLKN